ncbi:MAG: glycosyltransferase family 39 protein [Candidatus Gastranaerophilales bacterium]|nr:glycosyltransferase family 39 protein [Candidatus Gastranaerophilales bacterium]
MTKSNPKALFWILIAGFILSTFITIIKNNLSIHLDLFGSVLEDATINLELDNNAKESEFMVCFNDICRDTQSDKFKNIHYLRFVPEVFENEFSISPLKNISVVSRDNEFSGKVKNIFLYVGSNIYQYNQQDISKFKTKKIKINLDSNNKLLEYNAIILPNEYITNYKGIFNNICMIFLFLFYGYKALFVSYLMLFGAICVYIYNKDKFDFNFKLNQKLIFGLILLMTVLLRLNLITYFPLWLDELYTKTVAILDFSSCFKDAGNPPLFFITEFLAQKIFLNSDLTLKAVPFLFGCALPLAIYLVLKRINTNIAFFGAFFAGINIISIYQSQEVRSGSLCALLCTFSVYFLFKYLDENSNKNLTKYAIIAALAINTHYYLAIFSFTNFIYGFFKINLKKEKIKFLGVNFVCALTILPYLIISFNKALDDTFNGWIGTFNHYKFVYTIKEYFLNKYIFLIFIALILINLIFTYLSKEFKDKINITVNDNKKELFSYILYSFLAMLAVISLISIFIKPIFHKRLCLSIYSLLLLLEVLLISGIFDFNKAKNYQKIIKIFFSSIIFFIFLTVTHPMALNRACRIPEYVNFVAYDSEKFLKQGYEIHAMIIDYPNYLTYYPQIANKKILWHLINANSGFYLRKVDKNDFTKAKKAVIYLNTIGAEFKDAIKDKNNAYIIHSNSTSSARIIYNE